MPSSHRESGGGPPNAGTKNRASAIAKTAVLMKPLPKLILPVLSMAGSWVEIPTAESLAHCPAKEPFPYTIYEFRHDLVSL